MIKHSLSTYISKRNSWRVLENMPLVLIYLITHVGYEDVSEEATYLDALLSNLINQYILNISRGLYWLRITSFHL